MAIQIGKYKRPGIFTEEFDNSVISSPTVEGLKTTVIGFSKKGPVNAPVLLQNTNDLEKIFGSLDRNLERKGSFFHRTISKMLESSPVYAINLLATDDTLDTIEYKSLSTSSSKLNDVERDGAYRRFFDTTGFWKRDTESFINLTKNNTGYSDRLLNITNLSDKFITVFIFKSQLQGFDRTMIEWYGSIEKIPTYVNESDFASDYMVDAVIVSGDWSNYQELSVDTKWSNYFSNTGLRKEKVRDFSNDRNVNLLQYYEGLSLIPYFRDSNGRNIFIETVVNRDTDRTGLFCSFNMDLFETDFPKGLVDIMGNNLVQNNELVDSGQTDIEFLSYKETITESVLFTTTVLDRSGNVSCIDGYTSGSPSTSFRSSTWGGSSSSPNSNRTGYFAEGFIDGLEFNSASYSIATSSVTVKYSLFNTSIGIDPYVVMNGTKIDVAGTASFTMLSSNYEQTGTSNYISTFYLDSTGTVLAKHNITDNTPLALDSTNDIALGYLSFTVSSGSIATSSVSFTHLSVNTTGYKELIFGTSSDYYVTDMGSGSFKVEFLQTSVEDLSSNYVSHRKIRLFKHITNLLDSSNISKMSILVDNTTMEKYSLENTTITNIVTSTTSNKSFTLNTGLSNVPTNILNGGLIFYTLDDEMVLGTDGLITKATVGTASTGVVAKNSNLYKKFFDGVINTGDFFYGNLAQDTFDVDFMDSDGDDYVVFKNTTTPVSGTGFPYTASDESVILTDSVLNPGVFTIIDNTNYRSSLVDPNTGLTYSSGHYAYKININTIAESLSDVTKIYDYNTKHYLQMYLDNSNNLSVKFMDTLLASTEAIDSIFDYSFKVISDKSSFKQSIEIEVPSGYTQVPNKILINGSRYTEVKIGDFLEAYIDESSLEAGEVPKRLTRILTKRAYAPDTTLTEVTCDSRISKIEFNGDLQTMRYTTMDDYATTYKAISLKGFRVRQDSMPDGTETRQNEILNLIAKGTPIFKALTNKEAIDFRYLIDSFGLGLVERSKQQLVDICGERLDCLGFINMPSIHQFKNSSSPSFVDTEGVLQTEFIAKGGDPESNPAFLYSFGDGRGSTSVGYFTPYVTVNDNGRPFNAPPAMFVATTYMRKQNSNVTSITPWTIAAGVTNGKVSNIAGIEINFNPQDIEFLNQSQINPIVYKRNRGYVIETENTAQTLYKSALSYLHVREVLIELERELSAMLLDFQWKYNTSEVRAEIKLKADTICEKYVSKNGLFNFFNKCDEENNDQTIIDSQIGVLDTYVEPIRGMGIIVNNVTILRTGAISSGGFINQ